MRRPRGVGAALALALAAGLVGCAGAAPDPVPSPTHVDLEAWDPDDGNGLTLLSGPDARIAVLDAMRDAGTVAMTGAFTDAAGRTTQLDYAGSHRDYRVLFTADGTTVEIVVRGLDAYVREGGGETPFACVGARDTEIARWGALLDPVELVGELSADSSGLGAAEDEEVALVLGAESTAGALTVRTSGSALPIRLVRADGAGAVELDFSGWGEPADVGVPEPLDDDC